ncbi:hypothetical protein J2Z22_003112 [Paenibacillus forsythiae]|uniref:Uncharacterized protein n=1 Tax=Paenibacillus forsythiae TaxID=365616 RepID=A0ABU3H9R1_9BACL|nr:hypothetical protein [Paenibacillus forsythiae]
MEASFPFDCRFDSAVDASMRSDCGWLLLNLSVF